MFPWHAPGVCEPWGIKPGTLVAFCQCAMETLAKCLSTDESRSSSGSGYRYYEPYSPCQNRPADIRDRPAASPSDKGEAERRQPSSNGDYESMFDPDVVSLSFEDMANEFDNGQRQSCRYNYQ